MADPAEDRGDNLAPDATLAEDIPDEAARRDEQLKYYGGEKDDLDEEDLDNVDRGDSLEPPEIEDEEEEEEQASEDEEGGDDDASEDELDDGEPDADSEEAVDDDEASDGEEGDDGDVAESDDGDDRPEDKSGRDQRIPLSRFNEVNERMKRAEARLEQLEKQEEAIEEVAEGKYDFDAAEEEYTELLLNGDTKGAATKRSEIRAAEREAFLQEAKSSTAESIAHDAQITELNDLSTQAAEMYPLFDQRSEEFDGVATQKVLTFMRGYMSDNPELSPGDAFVNALSDTIVMYGLDQRYGYAEGETERKEESKTEKKKAPIRKTKEKLEVADKQPKSPAGAGRGSNEAGAAVPDIEKMSDAELGALPDETLARLRGDFVD